MATKSSKHRLGQAQVRLGVGAGRMRCRVLSGERCVRLIPDGDHVAGLRRPGLGPEYSFDHSLAGMVGQFGSLLSAASLWGSCRTGGPLSTGSPLGNRLGYSSLVVTGLFSLCLAQREGIKPLERLVRLSFMHCCTSTCLLSTWWSTTALGRDLVLRGVSRLDAFSGYPVRT